MQLATGINVFNLQKKEFSTGILRLTLFSQDGKPQAERIVFVNKNDQVKLQLAADTLSSELNGRSAFKLSSADTNGKPIAGNFSIAVTDADAAIDNEDNDFYSSILLSSELKGDIYSPGYYFTKNSDTLQRQLDLVMLTNGWRHFTWDSDHTAIKYPVERSQFIAGRILDYNEQLSAKYLRIKLLIQNQDSSKYIGYVSPDSTGSFILNNYDHGGISDIFMETADAKNHIKKLKIKLFGTLNDSLKDVCYQPLHIIGDSSKQVSEYFISNALNERQAQLILRGITLKTVNIREKKLTPTEEIINDHISPLYQSDKAYTLDLVSNPTLDVGIINYIKGRFPGLQIIGDGEGAQFYYRGAHTLGVTTGSNKENEYYPFFYINETPATIDDIIYLPMNEIALIRFIPTPVMFAPLNGGNIGALLIYTKNNRDDRRGIASSEKFDHYTFNGYSITREFYSPDYGGKTTDLHHDTRSTLYWNHDLVTGSSGELKFNFYNSGKAKKYRIIIQGMDEQGRLGNLNKVF